MFGIDIPVLIGIAVALPIYFLPAIIAHRRRHRNKNAIRVLNILAGWTFLGWVAAIVWAYTQNTED